MTEALIAPLKIDFVIPGTPQQQGSKIVSRYGGMYDANKKLAPWRQEGIAAAQAAYQGPKIITPVLVAAEFWFARPASHFGSGRNASKLKPTAPRYYSNAPDLDKLQRALGDVLEQSGLLQNDKLIVSWLNPVKYWTSDAPYTRVTILPAEG